MRLPFLSAVLAIANVCYSTNIILSNDDGWAELNIRQFFKSLTSHPFNFNVVLSAPSENKSGTGSTDVPPTALNITCEFDTCPVGSPPEGFNASFPRFNYVNAFPVNSMRFGIQTLAPKFFSKPFGRGKPEIDIAVAGPNVGNNLGPVTLISGTVGATTEAAKEGVPAIAFSGGSGNQVAFTASLADNSYAPVYAELSAKLTNALLFAGLPPIFSIFKTRLLASGTWVNVNYPESNATFCTKASQFKFILTRINTANATTPHDVFSCGSFRLPDETSTVGRTDGCFASVSVGNAVNKLDVSAAEQAVALNRLRSVLSCLPKAK